MTDFLKLVGNKVRLVRKVNGLTQEELAEVCGLQHTYIGGIERGERNISLQTLEKLAEGLSVDPFELLRFDRPNTEEFTSEKDILINIYSSILQNRNENEIRTLQRINRDIINLLDEQKSS